MLAAAWILVGCNTGTTSNPDSGGGGNDSGGVDPLVGVWFAQITTGPEMQSETLTFGADGSVTAAHSQINAATSADHAGCTEVVTENGTYAESTDRTMVTLTPGASGTTMRVWSGCTNATDDGSEVYAGTGFFLASASTIPYAISGTTLTIGPSGSSTMFTRQ